MSDQPPRRLRPRRSVHEPDHESARHQELTGGRQLRMMESMRDDGESMSGVSDTHLDLVSGGRAGRRDGGGRLLGGASRSGRGSDDGPSWRVDKAEGACGSAPETRAGT